MPGGRPTCKRVWFENQTEYNARMRCMQVQRDYDDRVAKLRKPSYGGPLVGKHDAIRFWTAGGQPAIFEFKRGERKHDLVFPNEKGRDYYKVGDFLFVEEHERTKVERQFEELKAKQPNGQSTLWTLATILLGSQPAMYKTGWQIKAIKPVLRGERRGEGHVKMQGVLFVENKPVLLEKTKDWSWLQLNESFHNARAAGSFVVTKAFAKVVIGLVEVVVGSVRGGVRQLIGKKAVLAAGKMAGKKGLRELVKRVLKAMGKAIPRATLSFVSEFVRDFAGRVRKDQALRQAVKAKGKGLTAVSIKPSLTVAAAKFATTMISETLSKSISDNLQNGLDQIMSIDPILGKTLKQKISQHLTTGLVDLMTAEGFNMVISSIAAAAAGAMDSRTGVMDEKKFSASLASELGKSLRGFFTTKWDNVVKKAADRIR